MTLVAEIEKYLRILAPHAHSRDGATLLKRAVEELSETKSISKGVEFHWQGMKFNLVSKTEFTDENGDHHDLDFLDSLQEWIASTYDQHVTNIGKWEAESKSYLKIGCMILKPADVVELLYSIRQTINELPDGENQ